MTCIGLVLCVFAGKAATDMECQKIFFSDVHIYVAVRRVEWQVRQVWHMRKHEGSLKKAKIGHRKLKGVTWPWDAHHHEAGLLCADFLVQVRWETASRATWVTRCDHSPRDRSVAHVAGPFAHQRRLGFATLEVLYSRSIPRRLQVTTKPCGILAALHTEA